MFAIIETVCASLLSWAVDPVFIPPDGMFTLVAFVTYTLFGGLLGALIGVTAMLFKPDRRVLGLSAKEMLLLTPPVAMAVNLAYVYPLGFLLVVELGLVILLLAALKTGKVARGQGLGFVASSWLIGIATVGPPWLIREGLKDASAMMKLLSIITLLLAIVMVSNRLSGKGNRQTMHGGTWPRGRRGIQYAIVAAAVLGSSFLPESSLSVQASHGSKIATGPNVLLISMDTVRADHTSIYGYERDSTPRLRAFARDSVVFEHAMSTGDMTLSSHASMFTGLYPRAHGAHYDPDNAPDGRPLSGRLVTLTELLADAGYSTYAVVSNSVYLDSRFGISKGFQYYDDRPFEHFFAKGSDYYLRNVVRDFLALFFPPAISDPEFRPAAQINVEAFRHIESLSQVRRPFFMFLNYMDGHWPYLPPAPYDGYYPGKLSDYKSRHFYASKERVCSLQGEISEEEQRHLVSQYDGGIAYLDEHLGQLFDKLRALGLYDNTLIIVTADHGEVFGYRKFIEHAVSVYADQIHVPLIIKFPNAKYNGRVQGLVSGIDILPTVMKVTGLVTPVTMPGLALTAEPPPVGRTIFSESYPNAAYRDWHPRFRRMQRAIMRGRLKGVFTDNGSKELYDLASDPQEKNNMIEQSIPEAVSFETDMDDWLQSVVPLTGATDEIDEALRDRLRSLGYVK